MDKKENLLKFKNDLLNRQCIQIELHWSTGEKSGIGNATAIRVAINSLLIEIDRQISEL